MEATEDDELDREFDDIVAAAEPIEEAEAVEVLATWRQTHAAMTQEKLDRGFRPHWKPRTQELDKRHRKAMAPH